MNTGDGAVVQHGPELPTSLHDAVHNGNQDMITVFLMSRDRNRPRLLPHDPDERGFSPVHYVAVSRTCLERIATLDLLLQYYSNEGKDMGAVETVLQVPDGKGNTLLHLAAELKRYFLVKRLVGLTSLKDVAFQHDLRSNGFARNYDKWFPVHFAANAHDKKAPLDLLTNLITTNRELSGFRYDPHVPTPVQVATKTHSVGALRVFLKHGFSFAPHGSKSLFQLVVAGGDSDAAITCLSYLLQLQKESEGAGDDDAAIRVDMRHPDGDMLLHLAAANRAPRLLQLILEEQEGVLDDVGLNKELPLHYIARSSDAASIACAKLLLDMKYHNDLASIARLVGLRGCPLSSPGRTALDVCCEQKNVPVAGLLMLATYEHDQEPNLDKHHWLDPGILNKLYEDIPLAMLSVLERASKFLEERSKAEEQDIEPGHEFAVITGVQVQGAKRACPDSAQLYMLLSHPRKVQEQLLVQPLTARFLLQKWNHYGARSQLAAVIQFGVLILYALVIAICNESRTNEEASGWCKGFAVLTTVAVILLLGKEVYQFWQTTNRWLYCKSWYNWSQILFGVTALLTVGLVLGSAHGWLWPVSIVGLVFAWLVAILQLKNLPSFGIYISIFGQVTCKSLKLLGLFGLPTFVAAGLIFRVLFPLRPKPESGADKDEMSPFQTLDYAGIVVKLLAMFIGELTFDEIMKGADLDKDAVRYFLALLFFALFAFIATIVLLNLLLAFAVDITREMQSRAKLEVAKSQLEQIYFWETFRPPTTIGLSWYSKSNSNAHPGDGAEETIALRTASNNP